MAEEPGRSEEQGSRQDHTFKRHGPQPPENDSGPSPGPSPSIEETRREQAHEHPAPRGSDRGEGRK
jgi:hypothetical protein